MITSIDVKSGMSPKTYHTHIIPLVLAKFRYWQDMFSHYLESFTPAFSAEAPEAESVKDVMFHTGLVKFD